MVFVLILLIIPPEAADHLATTFTQGLGQIKTGHGIGRGSLGDGFDQDFLPLFGQELNFVALQQLPNPSRRYSKQIRRDLPT